MYPIRRMLQTKERAHGVSHGLGEAGYDIRIKQEVRFQVEENEWQSTPSVMTRDVEIVGTEARYSNVVSNKGRFTLASAIEKFMMPNSLVGVVHDKSTWARRGLSVFNTVIEPGWQGFLTLELVYHGNEDLIIPAGAGIAQVIFSKVAEPRSYTGKYQNQEDKPVPSRDS